MVLKSFHGMIIMGPGWYNYHGFTIIASSTLLLYIASSSVVITFSTVLVEEHTHRK